MGVYTRAVSGHLLGKQFPVTRQQILNNATLELKQWNGCVFFVVHTEMLYVNYQYSTGECNKQKSYKIMKMQLFATLDKANRDTGNIRGLNLAAINHTTVQVNRLLL
jgi:hypothetical protein